jgi:hypothetical protein
LVLYRFMMTRRDSVRWLAAAGAAPCWATAAEAKWTTAWDKAALASALAVREPQFDAAEAMIVRKVGSAYNYHSTLRNVMAHPTRESLEYALLLLEGRQDERAGQILSRVLTLQEVDPGSPWHGLWGYYAEEPPAKMSPADWNWADFNGAALLMIAHRHGERLGPALRTRVLEAIRHAAASVRKRNVSMSYTNIAVQGTFVTLAAAQLLGDADMRNYATERLSRLAAAIDETGSFAEYNSPTYSEVTIANLTRMRMTLNDGVAQTLAERIHYRAWMHLGKHWHAPTMQLAGPQSRCYGTDIGRPLWLQKALGGKIQFASIDKLAGLEADVPVLDFQCPQELQSLFLETPAAHLHREVFRPKVGGATYLAPGYCLGAVNRGDFWVQSRPLVAYWGGAARPARWAQLRVVKDSYDFSSALLYSVQEKGYVLGLVNFRSPGGDKHISLDPIANGEFEASRLRLRLDMANLPEDAKVLSNGKPVFGNLEAKNRISFELDGGWLHFQVRGWGLGGRTPRLTVGLEESMMVVSLELIRGEATIRWKEWNEAWIAFTCCITAGREDGAMGFESVPGQGKVRLTWKTPAGVLGLTGAARVGTIEEQDAAFEETVNGAAVVWPRLADERLQRI